MTANRLTVLCVAALVLVGGFFRMYHLGDMSLWMDEAFSVQSARAIQRHGIPQLANGETVLNWLPAHVLMAGSLGVCGEMHRGARLPSAVAGTLMIALTSLMTYRLTRSRVAAVLAAFFVAFSVPDIAWSRQARGYVLLQVFGIGALILALRGTQRRTRGVWAGVGTLLALAVLTHRAGYLYWLMCAGVFALEAVSVRRRPAGEAASFRRAFPAVAVGLLLPLLAGVALPAGTSQGLAEAVAALDVLPAKPSYTLQYLALIFDFWRGNSVWMVAGIVLLLTAEWRTAVPVVLAVAAYLFVLSEKTLWFHVRYLVPLLPFLHLAVAAAMGRGLERLWAWNGSFAKKAAGMAAACALCTGTTLSQNLTFAPNAEIALGPTEPQADWRGAFRWLRSQEAAPATVMALPVFHDLYLGPDMGRKYFLPFTFTRVPGEWQESAPYAVAEPVRHAAALEALGGGYVVLDKFSFYSLRDEGIREGLARRRPVYVTPDGSVQIWRVPAPQGHRPAETAGAEAI